MTIGEERHHFHIRFATPKDVFKTESQVCIAVLNGRERFIGSQLKEYKTNASAREKASSLWCNDGLQSRAV